MGPRAGLDWWGKSCPTWIRSPDCPARRQSLYRLRYPAHYTELFVVLIFTIGYLHQAIFYTPVVFLKKWVYIKRT